MFLLEEISRTSNTNHALIKDDKVIYFSKCEFENIGDYFYLTLESVFSKTSFV